MTQSEQQLIACKLQIKEKNSLVDYISKERDDAVACKVAIETATFWIASERLRSLLDKIRGINQGNDIQNECADQPIHISSFKELVSYFENAVEDKRELCGKKLLLNYDKDKQLRILLVTHRLDYSGAPIALLYYATMLKEQGYRPVFAAKENNSLIDECEKNEIPVLIDDAINDDIRKYAGLFDVVIANTIVTAPVIKQLDGTDIPVLWWIHEADLIYNIDEIIQEVPQRLPANVSVYTAGPYAYEKLLKYRPLYKAKQLLYYIPDIKTLKEYSSEEKRFKFALVGMQEYRKGQDILADVIRMLDKDHLANCIFVFVGIKSDESIYRKLNELQTDYPDNITIINQLDRDEISAFYEQIDCLICPSRDDPMPVVVAEAMQHGKPVICSDHTGSAAIVDEMKCGITYSCSSKEQLSEAIKHMMNDGQLAKAYGKNALKAYKKYFAKDVFIVNALQSLSETISEVIN